MRLLYVLCPLLLGLVCFGQVLFGDRQFGFRDAADFYYPLYLRVQQEWQAGRLPLWEPEENGGMPLLGNPTAAVLYPGKLLYAVLKYPLAARLYVIAHIAWAYLAMFVLLRGWDLGPAAATLGALGYAFGAPALMQYANVVFLVGAAWMPLGFLAADRWLRLRRPRALVALAGVLAMQTLGGDPQAAYTTTVAAAAYAVGLSLAESPASPARRRWLVVLPLLAAYLGLVALTFATPALVKLTGIDRWPNAAQVAQGLWVLGVGGVVVRFLKRRAWGLEARLLGLVAAGLLAVLVSALQVVPCLEFIGHSLRATTGQGTASIYNFSIHPARLVETLWPGFFGSVAGGNHRWIEALPPNHDYQVWIESLYVGGLTLLLGLSAAGFRGDPPWRGWLTVVALGGILLSLGNYGSPLYWYRASTRPGSQRVGAESDPPHPAAEVVGEDGDGGPYWFFATALPGFRSFRYPGKFAVPASLGLCGLAALGYERLARDQGRRLVRWLGLGGAVVSLASLAFALSPPGGRAFRDLVTTHPEWTTTAFGPLDSSAAQFALGVALIQALVICGVAAGLATLAARRPAAASLLLLSAVVMDLGLANRPLIHTVPQTIFEQQPRVLELIERAEAREPSPGPFRIHRMPNWSPAAWLSSNSPDRPREIVAWEWDSIRPKYAIPYKYSYTYAMGTSEWLDLVLFFDSFPVALDDAAIRKFGLTPGQKIRYFTRRGFDLWNTRYFILPARLAVGSPIRGVWSFLPDTTEIDPEPGALEGPGGEAARKRLLYEHDVQILRNEAAFPRAWIVHRAKITKPIAGSSLDDRRPTMTEILYQDDELWHVDRKVVFDPRVLAWVEVEPTARPALVRGLSGAIPDPAETVSVDRIESERVELTARLETGGLVVLADIFYPGWRLTIDGEPAPIYRVNRAMRGALVPAGTHRLVYRYRPDSVRIGAIMSLVGLALTGLLLLGTRLDRPFLRRVAAPADPDPQDPSAVPIEDARSELG